MLLGQDFGSVIGGGRKKGPNPSLLVIGEHLLPDKTPETTGHELTCFPLQPFQCLLSKWPQ